MDTDELLKKLRTLAKKWDSEEDSHTSWDSYHPDTAHSGWSCAEELLAVLDHSESDLAQPPEA